MLTRCSFSHDVNCRELVISNLTAGAPLVGEVVVVDTRTRKSRNLARGKSLHVAPWISSTA